MAYFRIRNIEGILPGASVSMSAGPESGDRSEGVEDTRFVNAYGCYRRITGSKASELLQAARKAKAPLYHGTERDYGIFQGVPVAILEQLDPQGESAPCTWS